MVRLFGFDLPPSLATAWEKIFGYPRSTGFALSAGDYPYAIADALGVRVPFHFSWRDGISGPGITPAQTGVRQAFQHGLHIFALQPYYSPLNPTYGATGRNWWMHDADENDMWLINFFMHSQLPYSFADEYSPWDPHRYLVIFAGETGDNTGYVSTPPLDAGTYRVSMLETTRWIYYPIPGWICAVTVYYTDTDDVRHLIGPIGDVAPDADNNYATEANWYFTPFLAWDGYLADSLHTYRDATLDQGERISLQFKNKKVGDDPTYYLHLQVKVEKL